jgi:predicted nucleic acid-binding Zn ribbon protein
MRRTSRVSEKQVDANIRAWRRRRDREHKIAWTLVLVIVAVTLILPIIVR